MDYSFIAYIFLSIVIILGGVYTLHSMQRPYSAVMCLLLFILVIVFFGLRWFKGTRAKSTYTGTWPPLINMCPDYLVYFNHNGIDTCIDISGVNRSGGSFKAWTSEDTPQNPPSDPAKYFPHVYKRGGETTDILCQATKRAGLTWEGISDGDDCTYSYSGGKSDGAADESAACPSTTVSPPPVLAPKEDPTQKALRDFQNRAMRSVDYNYIKAVPINQA